MFNRQVLVLLILAGSACAQINTGEIGGSVRDPLGGLLAGATVVAERQATSLKYTAVTNGSGDKLRREFSLEIGTRNDVVTVDSAVGLDLGSGSITDGILETGVLKLPRKKAQAEGQAFGLLYKV